MRRRLTCTMVRRRVDRRCGNDYVTVVLSRQLQRVYSA